MAKAKPDIVILITSHNFVGRHLGKVMLIKCGLLIVCLHSFTYFGWLKSCMHVLTYIVCVLGLGKYTV